MIETDERMRAVETARLDLWAIGDITGKGAFTHVSMYQGAVVVRDVLGAGRSVGRLPRGPARHLHLARGRLGGAERTGRPRAGHRRRGERSGDLGARGWLAKEEGLIKLVADRRRGVLVGGCVVAEPGGEILSALEVAVHAEVPVANAARPCTSPTRPTTGRSSTR